MMPTKSMWTDSFTEFVNCKNNIGIARKLARLEVNRVGWNGGAKSHEISCVCGKTTCRHAYGNL
ncbi:unnamed protein product [Tenebrio molitor]|nr:unnamed protein product [Tenebrio molitor]